VSIFVLVTLVNLGILAGIDATRRANRNAIRDLRKKGLI
jgi:hypothetical protein